MRSPVIAKGRAAATQGTRSKTMRELEAEEEQLRAEQEAAQLRDELRALQSGVGGGGGGGENDIGEAGVSSGGNHSLHPNKMSLPGSEQ
eukprot:scaffold47936_cov18-Tisochrysis_lutea.AAC.3